MEHLNQPRERQAHEELGHTEVGYGVACVLVAAFLGILLAVLVLDWRSAPPLGPLLATRPGACELAAFERQLEDDSFVARALRPYVQGGTSALGAGNEQVYLGREGWLFHRAGFDYVTGPGFLEPARLRARVEGADACAEPPQPDPVAAIASFSAQLAARGVALVVVPTPVKAVVQPSKLSARFQGDEAPVQNPSWPAFVAALEAQGVEVFDPTPWLRAPDAYLVTDTHWRAPALVPVAEALAERIEARGSLVSVPAALARRAAEVENLGDLTTMLGLHAGQKRFPPERVATAPVAGGIAEAAEVLLLGDSFSNIYSSREAFAQDVGGRALDWGEAAGFGEQLAFALGRPVARIVRNAGGAHATREALAREVARDAARGRDRLAGVRVVVYQFAMRELAQGDWKELTLAPPPSGAEALDRAATPGGEAPPGSEPALGPSRVLRGIVASRSPVPRPGSVPYRDAVFSAHLRNVEGVGDGDSEVPREVVVYLFGMRDDRWTDAASWRPGDAVTLAVRDWEEVNVQARYASYNRTELDDFDLLLLPSYWAVSVSRGERGEGERQ